MDIEARIKQLCDKKKITSMYELAKLSGVPQSTIASIRPGTSPRLDTIEKICAALEISLSDFFTPDKPHLADIAAQWHKKINLSVRDEEAIIHKLRNPKVLEAARKDFVPRLRPYFETLGEDTSLKMVDQFNELTEDEQIAYLVPLLEDIVITNSEIDFVAGRPGEDPEADSIVQQILELSSRDRELIATILEFMNNKGDK